MKKLSEHEVPQISVFEMNIGHALKMCRSARKLSLDALAERTELSQSYLSMIESNKREPTLATVEKIAKALNVPTPIIMFLAAEKDELKGFDAETSSRLSIAAMNVIRAA